MLKSILLVLVAQGAYAGTAHFHLPLGASSEEHLRYIELHEMENAEVAEFAAAGDLEDTIYMGQRLLSWIKKYNSNSNDTVQLSDPNRKLNGYPIDAPVSNGNKDVSRRLKKVLKEAPLKFVQVLTGKGRLPTDLKIAKSDFIDWGRVVDGNYSRALRWRTQRRNLSRYRGRKSEDISGYWHLINMSDRRKMLSQYSKLASGQKVKIKQSLVGLCMNSNNSMRYCRSDFKQKLAAKNLNRMYLNYRAGGKSSYDRFFRFYHQRYDLIRRGKTIDYPFQRPSSSRLARWFKTTVENFWKTASWKLRIRFSGSAASSIQFQPDIVPHVSGSNSIVMNSRDDIREYSVKWTLAHEFGHTLGFRDCYLEFYDDSKSAMIYYEVDTANIMCSRAGLVIGTNEKAINKYYP